MIVTFLGIQGAGKDTQADLLVDRLGFKKITTGGLLREASKHDPILAQKLKTGELISDELVADLLKKELEKLIKKGQTNIVLSGFPRTLKQVEILDKILRELNTKLDRVVLFNLSEDEALKRLSYRRTCPKCGRVYHLIYNPPKKDGVCDIDGAKLYQRDDDTPEAIKVRFKKYYENINPIIDVYKKRGILVSIDASPTIEEIFRKVKRVIK